MADVEISYEGNVIASMSTSGTKTLLTAGKYCDDDITVDYTSPGGGGGTLPSVAVAMTGTTTGTTYVTTGTGTGSTDWEIHSYNPDYFSYNNGIFTVTAAGAGTYSMYIAGRGINNTSGNARYCHYRVYKNTSVIDSLESNTWGSTGGTLTQPLSITFAENDYIYTMTKCNTGAVNVMLSYILVKNT